MLDEFDFGADCAEAVSHIKVWPTEGTKVALVDADLIPYIVCYAVTPVMEARARYRVESGECASLSETMEFEEMKEKMCSVYNSWVTEAGCDAALPYLTNSEKNFRLKLAFSRQYKGTRQKEKPFFFKELKEFFIQHLQGILSDGEEADDLISIEAHRRNNLLKGQGIEIGSPTHREFADFVIVSSDKDSRITPGPHYDPEKRIHTFGTVLGELEPEWKPDGKMKKLRGSGLKFFYAQLIIGDSTDNYTGIPRKGDVFAYNLLDNCRSEKELFYAVLGAYKDHYGEGVIIENYRGGKRLCTPYELMLEQGRLAWMQTYKGELWRSDRSPVLWGAEASEWS